jgi:predicted hydrocarbon binding protein/KaiC/GvpD/RAD55 family RecA-like ATPase
MSLAKIQEPPDKGLVLLTGAPGAGKSTFCHQVVVKSITVNRPVIFVTSERSPAEVIGLLKEGGMVKPSGLYFVDAFTETVGLSHTGRSDTIYANCADLNSLSIAITQLQERTAPQGVLLAFDSLTSPYLFNGSEVVRFMRLFLSKYASEGNPILALMDEGCGREEDLGAMMSVAEGILRMEIRENSRVITVVKHPEMEPATIKVPMTKTWEKKIYDIRTWDREMTRRYHEVKQLRSESGDYVNIFWPNFMRWSSIIWDPQRFPKMMYESNKMPAAMLRESIRFFLWHKRFLFKLFMPEKLSRVKDMKKMVKLMNQQVMKQRRHGIIEYLEDVSRTDEHYIRVYENFECCGFEKVGAVMASILPPLAAGACEGIEKEEREWNAVETKCVGLGNPYCEFKLVPGGIGELEDSLRKDSSVVEMINQRLMYRLMEFLLHGKPLVERPRLGSDYLMGFETTLPAMTNERYRMALRMGGAKSGKEVGERLIEAGLNEDEAVKRVIRFLEHCKVGKVTMGETIRIRENCESFWTKFYTTKWEESCCFFTTGFISGLYSAVKNQHVRETRCIALGDPFCEWEII